jgi:3',5'-cyclic AMP phosphodiesterase CpdA
MHLMSQLCTWSRRRWKPSPSSWAWRLRSSDDVLVAAGDVVDRGPSPGEVIDFLRSRPHTIVIMGNHERKHVRGIFSYAQEITRRQLGDQ